MAKKKSAVDYDHARSLVEQDFAEVQADFAEGKPSQSPPDPSIAAACKTMFASNTQSSREALLGCLLARIEDRTINIRLPYVKHGPNSISLRQFDQGVVNPFLQDKRIPCSRGPYLAVFRRGWKFTETYPYSVKDPDDYRAFLGCIAFVEAADQSGLKSFLRYLLHLFVKLREASSVQLVRIPRMSLDQYDALMGLLLATPSGGRFPVLMAVATFLALKDYFHAPWEVKWQGINVADAPSGAGGDITIVQDDKIIMAAEVTERIVDRDRVIATFTTKIAEAGIEDYLFFAKPTEDSQARRQAHQYFAQGHEINFVELQQWIRASLVTIGTKGRMAFNRVLPDLIEANDVPTALKVAWNRHVTAVVGGQVSSKVGDAALGGGG